MHNTTPYTTEFQRSEGTHHFSTADGVPVTAVTSDTWEGFADQLQALPATKGYIMTPELMTSPGKVAGIPEQLPAVSERVGIVQEISRSHPEATVLLGTPSIDSTGAVRNSLAVIQDGELLGHIDKKLPRGDEKAVFTSEKRTQAALMRIGHAALICSDIIAASAASRTSPHALPDQTSTLMVSANWAIPRGKGLYEPDNQDDLMLFVPVFLRDAPAFSRTACLYNVLLSKIL